MTEKEHYDKEEARANDEKTHDNSNHESRHTYDVHLEEAKDHEKNWKEDQTKNQNNAN